MLSKFKVWWIRNLIINWWISKINQIMYYQFFFCAMSFLIYKICIQPEFGLQSMTSVYIYKYSLIKITANFIDHLLSDSRMTPVTIGQINLRKSVLSAPDHERPWPTEKRSEGRTTPSPLFNCLSKSPISKTRSDHYNGAL